MFYENPKKNQSAYLIRKETGAVTLRVLVRRRKCDDKLFSWPAEHWNEVAGMILPRGKRDLEYNQRLRELHELFVKLERVLDKCESIEEFRALWGKAIPTISEFQLQQYGEKEKRYRGAMARFKEVIGDKLVSRITAEDIEAFDRSLEADGLAPNTVKNYHIHLGALCRAAYRKGLTSQNAYKGFKSRTGSTERVREPVVIDESLIPTLWKMLEQEEGARRSTVVLLLLQCYTGARFCDAVQLTREKFEQGYFIASKNKRRCPLYLVEEMKPLLEELPLNLTYNSAKYRMKQFSEELGVTIRSHAARRMFASKLASKHNIYFAQTALGHSSSRMTERYIFAKEGELREAVEGLWKSE